MRFGMLFVICMISPLAYGGLGETMDVSAESVILRAAGKTETATNYKVVELVAASNTVREYVNPSGQVFAVRWRGAKRPELSAILGDYYAEYKVAAALTSRRQGRQSTSMKTDHLVLRKGGHMRDIRGFAYVPSLVPANVNAEVLP